MKHVQVQVRILNLQQFLCIICPQYNSQYVYMVSELCILFVFSI